MKSEDYYLSLKVLSRRLELSTRTLRALVRRTESPLPAFLINGRLRFRWVDVVNWLEAHRVQPLDVDAAVAEVLGAMGSRSDRTDNGAIRNPKHAGHREEALIRGKAK